MMACVIPGYTLDIHMSPSPRSLGGRGGGGGGGGQDEGGVVRCTGLLQVVLEGDAVPHVLLG